MSQKQDSNIKSLVSQQDSLDLLEALNGPRAVEQSEWRMLTALKSFQVIESVLKAYLCRANPADAAPPYQAAEVLELSLGRLTKKFANLGGSAELVAMLEEIRDDRNVIAHQALVCMEGGLADVIGAKPVSLARLKEIDLRAMKVMAALVAEFIRTAPKPLA
ncbi:hypothetical protein [Paraburkholderia bannensis]|uniref:hypothetical protein n=1 Tax=Paraburkholderia bannensis TaxID=765414 RepID=UPI002ABE1EC6|nr:hypothetical protein [Paraburkholderia bannensis]